MQRLTRLEFRTPLAGVASEVAVSDQPGSPSSIHGIA